MLPASGKPAGQRAVRLVAPGVPGEEGDFRRALAVAHDVVEEEVVELVRADLGLGRLDLAVLADRHQLGADLLREDRLEHRVGRLVELVGAGGPADQVLDQRLGHARR